MAGAEVEANDLVQMLKDQVVEQRDRIASMREIEKRQQFLWGDAYRDPKIREELVAFAALLKQLHAMLAVAEESEAKMKALSEGEGLDVSDEALDKVEEMILSGDINAEALGLAPEADEEDPTPESG